MDHHPRAPQHCPEAGAAARYLAGVNLGLVAAAAARRQGHRAQGARAPAALGAAAVSLETLPGATGLGYKTARRALPHALAPILGKLPAQDPRRTVAEVLADVAERLGGSAGADWLGGDTKSGLSDGGATSRCRLAARWRIIEAAANGWPVSASGRVQRGPEVLALKVRRRGSKRQDIKAATLLLGLCVEGRSLAQILARHHWPEHSKHTTALRAAALAALDRVALALGY